MFGLVPFMHNNVSNAKDNKSLFDMFDEPFFNNTFAPLKKVDTFKVDVKDTGAAYEFTADLPGVSKENIGVDYNNGYLTIKTTVDKTPEAKDEAAKDTKDEKSADKYLRRERYFGSMQRSFYIDDVDEKNIKASYKDGVLTVMLPKATKQPTSTAIKID